MSSNNWDDSDSENDNVVVEEKPVILPRARQPSIAKSLEKVQILENSVAGSVKNESDDDDSDSLSIGSDELNDEEDEDDMVILDYDQLLYKKKVISLFKCEYKNIISEFADVEIFLISFDSLIVECAAHSYHNWDVAGQSIVFNKQIDRFLTQFADIGGRFKLIVFTDLMQQFARDTTLSFARAAALAHIQNGPYAKDLLVYSSPIDEAWLKMLADLTPSFLMISTDNVSPSVCSTQDVSLTPYFETIVIHSLIKAIPVVLLQSITVNFVSVNAYYISPRLVYTKDWEGIFASHWESNGKTLQSYLSKSEKFTEFETVADFWVNVIQKAKKTGNGSETFDTLAAAVLLSSMICTRRESQRIYFPERQSAKRGLNVIRDRRLLLNTATSFLENADFKNVKISIADIWDGRMVFSIFDELSANEAVLPYRLQEDFAKLHQKAGLTVPLAVDTSEKLFDPLPEVVDPLNDLPILYSVTSPLLKRFVPEIANLNSKNVVTDGEVQDFAEYLKERNHWRLKSIEEIYAQKEEAIEDKWALKRANKSKQFLSRWYELFANSLEGRGSNLLVDFSRVPKGFASVEEESTDDKKTGGKGWTGQKQAKAAGSGGGGGGGGKKSGGKDAGKTKKDLILEANKKAKDQKLAESEKAKIKYGTQQGKESIAFLTNLMSSLDLPESKAQCVFEIAVKEGRILLDFPSGIDQLESRRIAAISLVARLKECFVKYWQYLESKQKDQVVDLWVSLGFEAPAGTKPSFEARQKKLNLEINMVYYQLQYGGELIDIQSDAKKDDRVSGFSPDGWQRKMLDSVDRGNSALIIAPTSAGKTFVSYYCIERVLRSSDTDVVVYVSPSKALINQVCGSVYARFRNKSTRRGMSLFGTLTPEYSQNALQCQVLITVPECLEELMLSRTPAVQKFVANIKYVVFDEVHSIGASEESHIWEQLLLLIQCPFLALSATIGNAEKLHEWLNTSELAKSNGKRKVDLISYGERYSELELSILNIDEVDLKGMYALEEEGEEKIKAKAKSNENLIISLMPYGVYMPEKLRMFSIPEDQQLTARQILHLYTRIAEVDAAAKKEFEPCNFFGQHGSKAVWISRSELRRFENSMKARFLEWLNTDEEKTKKVLEILSEPVQEQLENRSFPFNKQRVATEYIVPLVDELRAKEELPAICFNEDRYVCENLAIRLASELEERERVFMETDEFKNKYAIKDEEKLLKLAKRKRDEVEKKKKGERDEDAGPEKEDDEMDVLAMRKARVAQVLAKFKLRGRGGGDSDLFQKMTERMTKHRESSRLLLRLFERGIGYHHDGLSMVEKGAVEVLFRSGNLAVLFSTSTLSLGVNMPCKTVIFGVDTPSLTPLLYRQMSGRAGRRGFDHSGNVIFMSVPTGKIRRLLTASLSNLQGNPPFTVIFLLRLFAYVHQKDVLCLNSQQPITTIKQRAWTAHSLLGHSFSLHTRKERLDGTLQNQLKMFSAFSFQLLRHLQLLSPFGEAKNFAELATYVQSGESGILLFIYLMQKRRFHVLLKKYAAEPVKAKMMMLEVLANLFTNHRLTPMYNPNEKTELEKNYLVSLPGLPNELEPFVKEYNETVTGLYRKFLGASAKDKNLVDSSFKVGGNLTDENVSLTQEYLVAPLFDQYSHDESFLPVMDFEKKDHRGRKILKNAFAVDFFTHASRPYLRVVNRLKVSQQWFLLHDFVTILQRLSMGLQLMARPQDPLTLVIHDLFVEYDEKFRTVFGMRTRS